MKMTMVGGDWCVFCKKALELLDSKGIEVEYVDSVQEEERARKLIQSTGRTSLPQIWCGEEYVGGYEDLVSYLVEVA